MSIDPSLKSGDALAKHRNVLKRAERIERLAARGNFDPEDGVPLGLVKVANRKVVTGGKTKKAADGAPEDEGADGAAPASADA